MEPRKLQRDRNFGRQAVEVCYSRNSVHKSYSRGSYSLSFLLGGSERVGLKVVEKRVWARSKSLGFTGTSGPGCVHSGIRLSVSLE